MRLFESSLVQEFFRGARSLRASPTFVCLAVLCLGIGIGSTTLMFTVVNSALINPIRSIDAEGLAEIASRQQERGIVDPGMSWSGFAALRGSSAEFSRISALRTQTLSAGDDGAGRIEGAFVADDFFSILGVRPVFGRGMPEATEDADDAIVVLSESYWRGQLGGDDSIIGRTLRIDGTPRQIIGVVPDLLELGMPGAIRSARLWLPLTPAMQTADSDERPLRVYARVAADIHFATAAERLNAIAEGTTGIYPEGTGWNLVVRPFGFDPSAATRSMVLLGLSAAALVLLIACANVANLSLARGAFRRHEFAIRSAIGAERERIASQLLSESLLVSIAGAALGLVLARLGRDYLIEVIASVSGSPPFTAPIDANVVALTAAVTFVATAVFGLYPAISTAREAARARLTESGSGTTTARGQYRIRRVVVIGQVACSLSLLIGASILMRSFLNLAAFDGGIDAEGVTSVQLSATADGVSGSVAESVDRILGALESIPGVQGAAAANVVPLRGGGFRSGVSLSEGTAATAPSPRIIYAGVSPGFFQTFDIPQLSGRIFAENEQPGRVAVVNESMADLLWPDQDPLGREFRLDADPGRGSIVVIGVSGDVYSWDASDRPLPTAYLDLASFDNLPSWFFVDSGSDLRPVTADSLLQAIEPLGLSLANTPELMSESVGDIFWRQQIFGQWMSVFGMAALLLTAVGIYGILNNLVVQREREIGILMALGADRRTVLGMIFGHATKLTCIGILIGVFAAYLGARAMRGLLFGVEPLDFVAFLGMALVLAVTALAASARPALRAARVDPNVLLRS